MTAPNPLYQEGYSMTDTTDQQAVTVAQIDPCPSCGALPCDQVNTPEPVPATNQAGEADMGIPISHQAGDVALRAAAQKVVDAAPVNGNDRPHPAEYWAGIIALRAALATQPATSQEGERSAFGRELSRLHDLADPIGALAIRLSATANADLEEHGEWTWRDIAAEATRALAATPTSPTLSEDADEFETVEAWEHDDQRELSLLYNHAAHDRPQFNRIQMRQAIRHGRALALAQVKAS